MTGRIKILLADDHRVVREGLRALLKEEESFEIVGEAEDGDRVLEIVEEIEPDVLVLDVVLPKKSGIEVAGILKNRKPKLPILMLSMQDNAHTVNAAVRAGARGYILKGEGIEDLSQAIREVYGGGRYISREVSHLVSKDYTEKTYTEALSTREREILILVAEGFTAKQIAGKLGIAPKTVENHRANIMDRLGVRTIAGLVRHAMRLGLTS